MGAAREVSGENEATELSAKRNCLVSIEETVKSLR